MQNLASYLTMLGLPPQMIQSMMSGGMQSPGQLAVNAQPMANAAMNATPQYAAPQTGSLKIGGGGGGMGSMMGGSSGGSGGGGLMGMLGGMF